MENGILYHYTNQRGLIGIIRSETIWASDIFSLNDTTEFRLGVGLAQRETAKLIKLATTSDGAELEVIAARLEQLAEILHPETDYRAHSDSPPGWTMFVASFSGEGDQLGQWRGYCRYGDAFSIGFDFMRLESAIERNRSVLGFRLEKCIYDESEQVNTINRAIKKTIAELKIVPASCPTGKLHMLEAKQKSTIWTTLVEEMPRFKDKAFEGENEWRLMSFAPMLSSDVVHYRPGKNGLIPYFKFDLKPLTEHSQPAIRKVIIGPTAYRENAKRTTEGFLYSKGIEASVHNSQIPWRESKPNDS